MPMHIVQMIENYHAKEQQKKLNARLKSTYTTEQEYTPAEHE